MARHLKTIAALAVLIAAGVGLWAFATFAETAFMWSIAAVPAVGLLVLIYATIYEGMS